MENVLDVQNQITEMGYQAYSNMQWLEQAQELAETVYFACCKEMLKRIDTSAYELDAVLVALFNPLPNRRREIVKLCIDTPSEQQIWDFDLVDDQGQVLPLQFISREERVCPASDLYARPWPVYADRHWVYVDTGEIPAGGYKLLQLRKKHTFMRQAVFWPQTRKTKGDDLASSPNRMENRYLQVEICGDGSLNILDKTSGKRYCGLNYFQDEGDCGDYWMYYPPYHNRTYSSRGTSASVWLEDNGPLSATVAAKLIMQLPVNAKRPDNGIKGQSCRSTETAPVEILARYTLRQDARQVDVELEIHNTVQDHRMKVLFDTGIQAKTAAAQGHFHVDHRPLLPLRDENGAYFHELTTQPMQDFVDLSDGEQGFAVISDSLLEYEAQPGEAGTLALTLFRAVRNIICTEMRSAGNFPQEDGGQLLQKLSYHYAICLHDGNYTDGDLYKKTQRLNVPVLPIQTSRQLNCGKNPTTDSFYSIPDGLVLSCLKKAADGENWIARLYNPHSVTISGQMILPARLLWAQEVRLDEQTVSSAVCDGTALSVEVAPNEIKTYRFAMKKEGQ